MIAEVFISVSEQFKDDEKDLDAYFDFFDNVFVV